MNINLTSTLSQMAIQKTQAAQQLTEAIGNAQDPLATATTVFPFTMFPDTVTVDREKVTVAHRTFFRVAETTSIRIEDILNVTASVGPFFGTLKITSRFFDTKSPPYTISYLWREDTQRIKRILTGYSLAIQKGIDCSSLGSKELAVMLDKLGGGSQDN